jgi:hypothetical protein
MVLGDPEASTTILSRRELARALFRPRPLIGLGGRGLVDPVDISVIRGA